MLERVFPLPIPFQFIFGKPPESIDDREMDFLFVWNQDIQNKNFFCTLNEF